MLLILDQGWTYCSLAHRFFPNARRQKKASHRRESHGLRECHRGSRGRRGLDFHSLPHVHPQLSLPTWANLHLVTVEWLLETSFLIKRSHPSPSVLGHLEAGTAMAVALCLHLSFRATNYQQPNADKFSMRPVNLSALQAPLAGHQRHLEVLFYSKTLVCWQNIERFG